MFKEASVALEYPKVLEAVGAFCRSGVSSAEAGRLSPLPDAEEIRARLALIEEIRRMRQGGEDLGLTRYGAISDILSILRPKDAVLDPEELLELRPALEAMTAAAEAIARMEDQLPLTLAFTEGLLIGFPALVKRIGSTIGPEGEILDSASFELSALRVRLRALDRRVSRRLEEITLEEEFAPFMQDTFVTKRSGRWVVPVRMDSKGMVSGVVHDVSRTGETAFMEPLEIIGLSNELENLSAEARAEELRILRSLSTAIRGEAQEIEEQFQILLRLDVADAVAAFAERHALTSPGINLTGELRMDSALNPLLMLLETGTEVIPLDLSLGTGQGDAIEDGLKTEPCQAGQPEQAGQERKNVMTITGPNAGGKTVTMKTVGLVLLMALSGIPVPVRESTSIPFATDLLVDIGDDQSIEARLSTFSAHASNIARIIKAAGRSSLVLLDELGTGTDPTQGAALGASVLQELSDRGSLVIATTHLIDIVGYVHKSPGMVNASMAFDEESMRPLYRLRSGEPGQSHAIETAEAYGMPASVITRARELAGTIQVEFERLVRDLQARRLTLEREEDAITRTRKTIEAERDALSQRLAQAEDEKKTIVRKAYEEAREVVRSVKREAAGLLERAKKDKSKATLKEMDKAASTIEKKIDELTEKPVPLAIEEIRPGMRVHIASIRMDADVISVDTGQGRVRVNAGGKELEVQASSVLAPTGKKKPAEARTFYAERNTSASSEIKLLGLRVDEALELIEPFLNSASLAGLPSVRIIHGIGTGALRGAVREYLKGHPLAESFRPGDMHEGGDGATVVVLR